MTPAAVNDPMGSRVEEGGAFVIIKKKLKVRNLRAEKLFRNHAFEIQEISDADFIKNIYCSCRREILIIIRLEILLASIEIKNQNLGICLIINNLIIVMYLPGI